MPGDEDWPKKTFINRITLAFKSCLDSSNLLHFFPKMYRNIIGQYMVSLEVLNGCIAVAILLQLVFRNELFDVSA